MITQPITHTKSRIFQRLWLPVLSQVNRFMQRCILFSLSNSSGPAPLTQRSTAGRQWKNSNTKGLQLWINWVSQSMNFCGPTGGILTRMGRDSGWQCYACEIPLSGATALWWDIRWSEATLKAFSNSVGACATGGLGWGREAVPPLCFPAPKSKAWGRVTLTLAADRSQNFQQVHVFTPEQHGRQVLSQHSTEPRHPLENKRRLPNSFLGLKKIITQTSHETNKITTASHKRGVWWWWWVGWGCGGEGGLYILQSTDSNLIYSIA